MITKIPLFYINIQNRFYSFTLFGSCSSYPQWGVADAHIWLLSLQPSNTNSISSRVSSYRIFFQLELSRSHSRTQTHTMCAFRNNVERAAHWWRNYMRKWEEVGGSGRKWERERARNNKRQLVKNARTIYLHISAHYTLNTSNAFWILILNRAEYTTSVEWNDSEWIYLSLLLSELIVL